MNPPPGVPPHEIIQMQHGRAAPIPMYANTRLGRAMSHVLVVHVPFVP